MFTPKTAQECIAWPTAGTGNISNAPVHSNIDITSRILAERKQQVVKMPGDIGAELKLEWFEFVDREAKSLYWSEVLRRKAWQEPQKEK